MDAADLRVFQAVAVTGSMNKAALELNSVQPNVIARIKSLEEEVGRRRPPTALPDEVFVAGRCAARSLSAGRRSIAPARCAPSPNW
jgi:Bacterial regulatory helix-turn-helix protein, lysR family